MNCSNCSTTINPDDYEDGRCSYCHEPAEYQKGYQDAIRHIYPVAGLQIVNPLDVDHAILAVANLRKDSEGLKATIKTLREELKFEREYAQNLYDWTTSENETPILAGIYVMIKERIMAEVLHTPEWSQTPPTKTGLYWMWVGDEDHVPIPLNIGSNDQGAWIMPGQYGMERATFFGAYPDSWWMPVQEPSLPNSM